MEGRLTRTLKLTKSPETVAPLDRAFAAHVRDVNIDLDLIDSAVASLIASGGGVDIPTGDARWVNVTGDTMTGTLVVNPQLGINTATPGTINGTVPGGDALTFPLHVKRSGVGSTYAVVDGSGAVGVLLNDAGQPFNGRLWAFEVNAGQFMVRSYTDAGASTTRFSLDRVGSAVLGSAIPAWGGAFRALTVNNDFSVVSTGGGSADLARNLYRDASTWRLIRTDAAEVIDMSGGVITWSSAPSAAAGSPAALATRMTLDGAGLTVAARVAVGTGTFVAGSLYRDATLGLVVAGAMGSTNDLTLTNNAGAQALTIPAGTTNLAAARLVGIGAAPVTGWLSGFGILDYYAARGALMVGNSGGTYLLQNAYNDGTWKTPYTGASQIAYLPSSGEFILFQQASQGPGALALAQTLKVEVGGKLTVGPTSSHGIRASRVTVAAGGEAFITAGAVGGLLVIHDDSGLYVAVMLLSAFGNSVTMISNPSAVFQTTGSTANTIVVYWNGGVGNFVAHNYFSTAQTLDWYFIACT